MPVYRPTLSGAVMTEETLGREAAKAGGSGGECPQCKARISVGAGHVQIRGSQVTLFCSAACVSASQVSLEPVVSVAKKDGSRVPKLVVMSLGIAMLVRPRVDSAPIEELMAEWLAELSSAKDVVSKIDTLVPRVAVEERENFDASFAASIAGESWVHPLRAPRRMPQRDGRVFGAERPGDRPAECRSGHCGIDVGGTWGEPVFAANAGVVVRVQRGQNSDHGGRYVRLSHRDGTVFSQYFHLSAIPPWIRVGEPVKAGQMVGLLGQTGVVRSGPHLHFTISVRPDPKGPEHFIDPEPLAALWPLLEEGTVNTPWIASTRGIPGVPHGASGRRKRTARLRGRATRGAAAQTGAMTPAVPAADVPASVAESAVGQ